MENFNTAPITNTEKNPLDAKYEELAAARREELTLRNQLTIPAIPSEAEKIKRSYDEVAAKVKQLEEEFDALKAANNVRLEEKFAETTNELRPETETVVQGTDAANDSGFDQTILVNDR